MNCKGATTEWGSHNFYNCWIEEYPPLLWG